MWRAAYSMENAIVRKQSTVGAQDYFSGTLDCPDVLALRRALRPLVLHTEVAQVPGQFFRGEREVNAFTRQNDLR